ncbi:hypothetical protein [Magnetospirillum sp. 15-1]|uniref:hypothetical protein n=1 Tax=Magnetospirillum sp. 15-1 TaxID=1979370 RepID=UPI0011425625|nr:hypothetical protein [Magnetospirillum sp. 15-1]
MIKGFRTIVLYIVLGPIIPITFIFMMGYSWLMTSQGLTLLQFVPHDVDFLPIKIKGEWLSYLLSFFLHVSTMMYYVVIATRRRKKSGNVWFAIATTLFLTFFSWTIYANLLSITSRAKNADYPNTITSNLGIVNRLVDNTALEMNNAVVGAINARNVRATDSRNGLDESGIKKCGPQCRGFLDQRDRISNRYSVFTQPIAAVTASKPENHDTDGLNRYYAETMARVEQLSQRILHFNEFAKDEDIGTSINIDSIEKSTALTIVRGMFGRQNAFNPIDEVQKEIVRNFTEFLRGSPDASFIISLFQAMLPDMILFYFSAINKSWGGIRGFIEDEIDDIENDNEQIRKVVTARQKGNFWSGVEKASRGSRDALNAMKSRLGI